MKHGGGSRDGKSVQQNGHTSLARRHNGGSRTALETQIKVEKEPRVKIAIEQALAAMG